MVNYAKEHPSVEFLIRPRFSKVPQAIATYSISISSNPVDTGRVEVISFKKKNIHQIHEALMDLRNGSGLEPKKFHIGVNSHAPAIRNLWDPWHGANLCPFNGTEQQWRRTLKFSRVKLAQQRKSEKAALLKNFSTLYDNSKHQLTSRLNRLEK
ncbi:putative large subunit of mitochondrial ribosomal protein [Mitosporidium daphniae]|uniref:Putative large subunit of mitochondrial ribosomal protein n=1 Tax=Mitosporidium daphniae TaxID=1485682 RepID=A0A098VY93_9MICR|nr:putative large subunit of mitochondrial ribosomal protein [Mitosporidium daphniae]KGG52746.1 putative large subunit of mitochondrial ribosomal protein [Mitosporidium daphniae]|eukprot:XP_013239173.1 putative large subunit of mitochondrial ribosomal protein [Mitosporidium daphniae]